MRYEVTLIKHIRSYKIVTVDAMSPQAARLAARKHDKQYPDGYCDTETTQIQTKVRPIASDEPL